MVTEPRDQGALSKGLRLGPLELRLVDSEAELQAVQRLRFRVFYKEMHARPTPRMTELERDFDAFDDICEHLIVRDTTQGSDAAVVATMRLLRRSVLPADCSFYTAGEFDISRLLAIDGELVELGRSCVDMNYRAGAAIQALFRGLGAYVVQHGILYMFGCASLHGTDPDSLALPLSHMAYHLPAPAVLRPRALDHLYVDMKRMAPASFDTAEGLASLPPLIKGYARAGCRFGDGAVIDHQFNTTDVCVLLDVSVVEGRYGRRYRGDGEAEAGPGGA